ncbi:hypothetical protein RJ641_032630 [Dillenia turbinata]|uniref:Uncharacterized protein n=1 Tax=Dillenia turbinata TaxID=194707 RepID=A0AAN8ZIN0_9MAGN
MALDVLSALDTARTQYFHFKAIIIAGMVLFTDAYDLFCIPNIMKLIHLIYYEKTDFSHVLVSAMVVIPRGNRHWSPCFWLTWRLCWKNDCVWLCVGVDGLPFNWMWFLILLHHKLCDHQPFYLQGFGILASSIITMAFCAIFNGLSDATKYLTPEEADHVWRLILILGAIPTGLTYYWRVMMPETTRYAAPVEQNIPKATFQNSKGLPNTQSYPPCSMQFLQHHGIDLFACVISCFLVDVVYYSSNLFQSHIYSRHLLDPDEINAHQEAYEVAKLQAIIAICSTIPGYWATVLFTDHVVYGLAFFFSNFGPNTTTFIVPAELFPARFLATCHGISGAVGKKGFKREGNDSIVVESGIGVYFRHVADFFFYTETMGRSLEENEKE